MTINPEFEQKKLKAVEAIDFLYNHPAINPGLMGSNIADGVTFDLNPVCKYGYLKSANSGFSVYANDEFAPRFNDELQKKWDELGITSDFEKQFTCVNIDYERIFGEPWKFDHVEYLYELSFYVFVGNSKNNHECYDPKKWECYNLDVNVDNILLTFEDMVIDMAERVKESAGDFNAWNDFNANGRLNMGKINHLWLKWYIEKNGEEKIVKDWSQEILDNWKKLIKEA